MQTKTKQGFTVIELTLAMLFVSFLLMAIVMTVIQAGQIYNRGIILKSVNQSGRDISDTLRRDFTGTDQRMIVRSGASINSPIVHTINGGGGQASGRFCLGGYSYLWNNPRVLDGGPDSAGVVKDSANNPINFVRVVDQEADLCNKSSSGAYISVLEDDSRVTHLLKTKADSEDVVLSIHSLSVERVASVSDGNDGLFEVKFTIGTSKLSEINGQSCRPPVDQESNLEFCAINQFNMIARTNG